MLSETVAKGIEITNGPEASETVKFIMLFNKFFDFLNVDNYCERVKKRNSFKEPYRSPNDFRLKWLVEEFIPSWEKSVNDRVGFDKEEKAKMKLSKETLLGVRFTGESI